MRARHYSGEHGAGTADYDSLLVFFVTGYLVLLFGAIHAVRPKPSTLALAGGCIVGAILTKSVAGAMPGLGVGVYLALIGRVGRIANQRYAAAGAVVVGVVLLFLVVREIAAPGYLAASWHNDVAGRFSGSLVGMGKPATFYLSILWAGYFSATPLLVVAPLVVRLTRGRGRAALVYSLCIAATLIATTSLAASKLHHYVLPAMPFMAAAAAITLDTIWRRRRAETGMVGVALAIVGVVAIGLAVEGGLIRRYGAPAAVRRRGIGGIWRVVRPAGAATAARRRGGSGFREPWRSALCAGAARLPPVVAAARRVDRLGDRDRRPARGDAGELRSGDGGVPRRPRCRGMRRGSPVAANFTSRTTSAIGPRFHSIGYGKPRGRVCLVRARSNRST